MKDFLKALWSEQTAFEVKGPFALNYRGEASVQVIMNKRRIACPNESLRNLVLRADLVSRSVERLHLVGECNGGEAGKVEKLKKPNYHHLLLLCWSFAEVCHEHCVVLPDLSFNGSLVALLPQSDTFLICAAPVAMIMAKNPKVLALGP